MICWAASSRAKVRGDFFCKSAIYSPQFVHKVDEMHVDFWFEQMTGHGLQVVECCSSEFVKGYPLLKILNYNILKGITNQ